MSTRSNPRSLTALKPYQDNPSVTPKISVVKERLIIFTRYPRPGTAKTRLIPALGAEGAATLQRRMTEHTLSQVKNLSPAISVEIWFADDDRATQGQMQDWLGTEWVYQHQGKGDLGDRLITASQSAFAAGMERVIIIGTDCPGLDSDRITQAFQALQDHDLVLGDATDGGYYLIGLRRSTPELFQGISWSTSAVRQQTVAIALKLGLTTAHLPALSDIDYPEDLPIWQAVLDAQRPLISVIVPTLNEAKALEQWGHKVIPGELIVVDGGSEDDTIALAKDLGATVITSEPGRARQMNQGAAIAQSNILLFLHADTRLPDHFPELVQQTLAQPQVVAGAFELAIEGDLPGLRWVEWGVNWRSRYLQMPYGDQAIFLKAETFRQLGGFASLPIMEDFEFMKRLQKLGKVAIAPASVITSGRRWQKLGVIRTTLINQVAIAAYYLGVSPERISHLYRSAAAKTSRSKGL